MVEKSIVQEAKDIQLAMELISLGAPFADAGE